MGLERVNTEFICSIHSYKHIYKPTHILNCVLVDCWVFFIIHKQIQIKLTKPSCLESEGAMVKYSEINR